MKIDLIFDRELVIKNKIRARKNFSNHNFLHHLVSQILLDRIEIYQKKPIKILEIGAMDNFLEKKISEKFNSEKSDQKNSFEYRKINDCEVFNFDEKDQKFDLIITNLNLHFINRIEEFLFSAYQNLSEGGIFLASFFGEENLYELANVIAKSEEELYGNFSARMIPTIDIKTAASLFKKIGFKNPASEVEKIEIEYSEILNLFKDIRNMGQSNCLAKRSKKFMTKSFFNKIIENYQNLYPRKTATAQILIVSGTK